MSVIGGGGGGLVQPTSHGLLLNKDEMRQPFEGQLCKFTNVMKGWQYRWFVLNPEIGKLEYYLLEERHGKCRSSQHLAGLIVLPSDEDSQTFSVNFASGDAFKLRAANVRERQVWVDRLRAVALMHDQAIAQNHPPLPIREHVMPPTPPGSRSHIANGEPSQQLQHLSLSLLDAFGSVHDIIHQTQLKVDDMCKYIEDFPTTTASAASTSSSASASSGGPKRLDEDLLLLKATAHASLISLEQGLSILQDYREINQGPLMAAATTSHPHISKSVFALPSPLVGGVGSPRKSVSGMSPFFPGSPSHTKSSLKAKSSFSSSTNSLPADLKTPTSTSLAAATSNQQQQQQQQQPHPS